MNGNVPFADLHNHSLPGLDDGCQSITETLETLQQFLAEGVGALAVTPHLTLPGHPGARELQHRLDEIRASYDQVMEQVTGRRDVPWIRLGQEVLAPDRDQIRRVLDRADVGVAGTAFLLVEFGFELGPEHEAVIREVHAAGRQILVAHPERYRYPAGVDPVETVRRWFDLGAFLQVNLGSLCGEYGGPGGHAQGLGWRLLEEGLVHVLASDHHGVNRPQIRHRAIFDALANRGGEVQARWLLGTNPLNILRGELPARVPPLPSPAAEPALAGIAG